MLVKYIRHPHALHQLVGCVVACTIDGEVRIGWSQCNPLDQFRKKRAKQIAVARAHFGTNKHATPYKFYLPDGTMYRRDIFEAEIIHMNDRAARYFKPGVEV